MGEWKGEEGRVKVAEEQCDVAKGDLGFQVSSTFHRLGK